MKSILIDGFNLRLDKGTGVATYARNLSHAAKEMGLDVQVLYDVVGANHKNAALNEINFFDQGREKKVSKFKRKKALIKNSLFGARAREIPMSGAVISSTFQAKLPRFDAIVNAPDVFHESEMYFRLSRRMTPRRLPVVLANDRSVDLAHWTYPLPIFLPGAKNIYTLHDLVPLRLPYTTLQNKVHYFDLVKMLAQRADHIVTVSETSRRDIIDLLEIDETKVTNTYQAVEIPQKYVDKAEDVVRREVAGVANVEFKNYFLYFGAIEPKKNVGRLIEAYLASNISAPLLLVGPTAWMAEQELRHLGGDAIHQGSVNFRDQRVIRLEYVHYSLLVSLIRGAKAVLFPSIYEGFGLPVLEAMKLGTPVLTSNTGALKEIAGSAALLVDPYDTADIAEGIIALDSSDELRKKYAALGEQQAEKFSHAAYVARLTQLYSRL